MSYSSYSVPNESETVLSGVILNYDSMTVSSGGTAQETTVNSGSYIILSCGGVANSTTVNNSGGLYVYPGGTANKTTVNSSGYMAVDSGLADDVTVNFGGTLYIYSGGTATAIRENGGWVNINEGASVTFTPNTFSGVDM